MDLETSFDPDAAATGDGIYGLPHTPEQARVVLLPVPWQATVSYGSGTADGPAAILAASRQVDLTDRETGKPYAAGIAMLPIPARARAWSDEAHALSRPIVERGGPGDDPALQAAAARVEALSIQLNAEVEAETRRWLDAGKLVGVVGGDHSSPLGAIRAIAERHPGAGILHFDAHLDLRQSYEGLRYSHASIMWNVLQEAPGIARLVHVGIRDFGAAEQVLVEERPDRLRAHFDADLRAQLLEGKTWRDIAGRIVADLPREVYVSFDIDGLDPALCPHTGTPVVGGLSFAEACYLLRAVQRSGRRIVGFDLCEVAPDPEGRSEWDGNVAARVLYKLIGFALLSQPAGR